MRLIVSSIKSNTSMNQPLTQKVRILITAIVTLLVWAHILWDYTHGGIPVHHILHSADLPGIPNWWGAIVLPIFTYFLLLRIAKRINPPESKDSLIQSILRVLAGVVFAVSISVCFMNGIEVTDYIMGLIFLLSFIFPLYKSEYLLGWVLGSAFSFGAILPMAFGSILCLLFFLTFKLSRGVIGLVRPKTQ